MSDRTDDQKERLREAARLANVAVSNGAIDDLDDNDVVVIEPVVTALPALLDENDRLRDDVLRVTLLNERLCECGDVLDGNQGARCGNCQTAEWSVLTRERDEARAELDRLRGETTLLRERAAHAEQERDRLREERDELRRRLDAIKQLDVSPAASGEVFVDIRPLDPNPHGADTALLHWSREDGWAHGPSGSGTLGEMLHAMAVSALADRERGEPNDG